MLRHQQPPPEYASRYSPAIRSGYLKGLNGETDAAGLEDLVRAMARDAHASGLTAERAIVVLKISIHGTPLPELAPRLDTADDRRQYRLFEVMIGWTLDEFFGRRLPDAARPDRLTT